MIRVLLWIPIIGFIINEIIEYYDEDDSDMGDTGGLFFVYHFMIAIVLGSVAMVYLRIFE